MGGLAGPKCGREAASASPAEAARPLPAGWRGARSSPARRALSPAGGRDRARTVPALRAHPLPAAQGATAFHTPKLGVGRGGVSSITPAPARPRSRSAGRGSWLPACGGLEVPARPGVGGAVGGTRIAEPPLGCAPSPPSSGRPPALRGARTPHPRGVADGEGVLGRPLAGAPAPSRRTRSPRGPRPRRPRLGVPPPHPTSCELTRSLPLIAELNINH